MGLAMAHRGPDGHAVLARRGRGLRVPPPGDHRPRRALDQPMHLGPLHLVFNGEIYNYRELRAELAGLGHAFAHRGRHRGPAARLGRSGARARWTGSTRCSRSRSGTSATRSLTLAVDPFGEKPLLLAREPATGSCSAPTCGRCARRCPALGRAATTRAARLPRRSADAAGSARTLLRAACDRLPGRAPAALARRRGRARAATGRPRPVDVPTLPEDAARAAARAADRLDPPAAAQRRPGRDVAERRRGLAARSSACRPRWPATTAATRSPPASRATSATSGTTRSARRRSAPASSSTTRVEPTTETLLADLDALVRDQEEPFASLSVYAQWRVTRPPATRASRCCSTGRAADELFGGYAGIDGFALRAAGPRARARPARRAGRAVRALCAGRLPAAHAAGAATRLRPDAAPASRRPPPRRRPAPEGAGRARSPLRARAAAPGVRHQPARSCCATPTATRWPTRARCACRSWTGASPSSRSRCRPSS